MARLRPLQRGNDRREAREPGVLYIQAHERTDPIAYLMKTIAMIVKTIVKMATVSTMPRAPK